MNEEQIKADIDMWLDSLEGNLVHGFGISKEGARDEIMSLIAEEQKSLLEEKQKELFGKLLRAANEIDEANSFLEFRTNTIHRPVYSAMLREVWATAHSKIDQLKAHLTTGGENEK